MRICARPWPRHQAKDKAALWLQCRRRALVARGHVDGLRFERDKVDLMKRMYKQQNLAERWIQLPSWSPGSTAGAKILSISKVVRYGNIAVRTVNPMQSWQNEAAALKIQKVYHRYHIRCRISAMKQQKRLDRKFQQKELLKNSAINIQRAFRGHRGRIRGEQAAHGMKAVLIQTIFRGFHARLKMNLLQQKIAAATLVQKTWRGHYAFAKYDTFMSLNRTRLRPALRIQTYARIYVARVRVARVRSTQQLAAEKRAASKARLSFCLQRVRNQLMIEVHSCDSLLHRSTMCVR
jgi:hypothetical protein